MKSSSLRAYLFVWISPKPGDGIMAVGDARTFLKKAVADKHLRDQLYKASTGEAINKLLKARNMSFTQTELEEAYRGLLVQSQTEEEANVVREIKNWWDFLSTAIDW